MLWTNQVLPLLVQRDSLNTSRSKDRTVSLFFLPKPLHSPHPLGSYIALPSSRSLFKTNMVKVCARSRRSNGKIGDCEQSKKIFGTDCTTLLSRSDFLIPTYTLCCNELIFVYPCYQVWFYHRKLLGMPTLCLCP